jgi:hypothetical protein
VVQYSIVPVLAGIPLFARAHPTRTLVLAAAAAPLTLVSIMAATAVALVVAFPADVLPWRARGRLYDRLGTQRRLDRRTLPAWKQVDGHDRSEGRGGR